MKQVQPHLLIAREQFKLDRVHRYRLLNLFNIQNLKEVAGRNVDVMRVVQRRVDQRRLNHLRPGHPLNGWMYMRIFHRKVVLKSLRYQLYMGVMFNEECVLSAWFIEHPII